MHMHCVGLSLLLKVWDMWLTDYDPLFHSHIFEGCPLNSKEGKSSIGKGKGLCPSLHQKSSLGEEGKSSTEEGKDLCPSPEEGKSSTEEGKDLCPSLYQKSSWLSYHGTSITSAIVSVAMNWINKSEKVFGEPAPNDDKHPRAGQQAKDYAAGTYEAAIQRGIYTTMQWPKGLSYASPYARLPVKVVAHIVLLVRVPGSLEKVGVSVQVGEARKKSFCCQQDLEGKEYRLDCNWAALDMEKTFEAVIEAYKGETSEVRQLGFIRWMLHGDRRYMTPEWRQACSEHSMPFDPEIQERRSRKAMQMKAQTTHTGEERWSNLDNHCIECISSGCSIVGFFVGYSVALGKRNDLCESRKKDAETNIDWNMMPPLCRPDDVDEKNKQVEETRRTKEMLRADASHGIVEDGPGKGDAAGHGDNPYEVDYDE